MPETNDNSNGKSYRYTLKINFVSFRHTLRGGMYVSESFRNQGVASATVEFLLKSAPLDKTVYCIPFEHLVPFYKRFGFKLCMNHDLVPKELLDKYLWCKGKYPQPTAPLVLNT